MAWIGDVIAPSGLVAQILRCMGILAGYIVPAVLVLLPIRLFTKVPSFVFRKLLHMVAFTCVSLMIVAADSWQAAALTSVIVAVALYPLLAAIEGMPWYADLFVQKKPGEIRKSLLMLFFTFAGVVTLAWGVFGQPHIAATAILMWGTGDAQAALVGIPYGRHKVTLPLADGKKSWEGSLAMLGMALFVGFLMLVTLQGLPFPSAFALASAGALVGTATELFTPSEYDTVTVPLAIVVALLALLPLAG
ncbi:MAG: hypothetical protein IJ092_11415 [Atopobiaceae bacterium]|nr:hypothetical protein [Atopobiaceae bacterium]